MFNLFNKGPKIRAGKQNNQEEKKKTVAVGLTGGKTPRPANVLGEAWKKLQKMDRKQAYTWGGIAVVALVALISIASMGGQDAEDFTDFETRGYDLANMPFSTDEAEQYLLASKYPDMNDKAHSGLYSEAEKEARQAEDAAEAQAQLDKSASSSGSEYRPNRYYGGGGSRGGGAASPTQVGSLNSAGLKSASGSGMKSTFGPQGDFSNFRSQEKGKDKFVPSGPGKGNARTALIQTAQASRAAAGLKNDKLLNAKKAMMGGNVKGSDAFLDDSGAVNLGAAKGLELDTNAPISSADLSGLGDALQDANQDAAAEDQQEEEMEWWEEMLIDVAKQIAQGLVNWGMSAAQDAVKVAQAGNAAEKATWQQQIEGYEQLIPPISTEPVAEMNLAGEASLRELASSLGGTLSDDMQTITCTTYDHDLAETTVYTVTAGDNSSFKVTAPEGEKIDLTKKEARRIKDSSYIDVDNNYFGGEGQRLSRQANLDTRARMRGSASLSSNEGPDSTTINGTSHTGRFTKDRKIFISDDGTLYDCPSENSCVERTKK